MVTCLANSGFNTGPYHWVIAFRSGSLDRPVNLKETFCNILYQIPAHFFLKKMVTLKVVAGHG